MRATTQTTPRRRGRPPKAIPAVNRQFPGTVISITSVPRLRVGIICEIRASRFPENIGARVEIVGFYTDGTVEVRPLGRALTGVDDETGKSAEVWIARTRPDQLYRVGNY